MAGDWVKVEHVTPDKPEVWRMADILSIDADAVVGKLLRVWIWADQQTVSGHAASVTKSLLNRVAGVTGFAEAMLQVGWLSESEAGVEFTNFCRHNGQTAKTRALSKNRKQVHRSRHDSVTLPAFHERDQIVTREEKRREENIESDSDGDESPDVVIPAAMDTQPVHSAVRLWKRHLEHVAPDKAIIANSPQEQMFWQEISRMGPDRFLAAVEYSVARKYLSLVEKPPPRTAKASGGGGGGMSARDRIRAVGTSGGGDVAK